MFAKIKLILILIGLNLVVLGQNADTIPTTEPTESSTKIGFVTLDNDTLFNFEESLGPFSAKERADAVNKRLKQLEKEIRIYPDSFHVISDIGFSTVFYKDMPLISISDADVAGKNKNKEELATDYQQVLQKKYSPAHEKMSLIYWVLHILYTILALAGLIVIFKLTNRLFVWLATFVEHYQKQIKKKRKSFWRYLAPKGPDSFFSFLLKISKIVLLAFILFLYLPLMFSFLPWTEGLVSKFYTFISGPLKLIFQSLWGFISQKLIYIVIIFFISRYILRIMGFVTGEIEKNKLKINGFHREWARPTYNIFKILVIAFTLVFMFPYLPGSDSKAFQGVSIFLGILFSLGSTSAIANIVAGIVITYMRPFQIGDRVKIGETIGEIVEKNLLVTRINTLKNEDVTIPNATIINTHLWNYTKNASKMGIILHTSVTIGYDVPSQTVINLLLKAAQNTPNLTRDFKPFVLQKSLSDFYVEYELNVYTKQPGKMAQFYSDIHKSILQEFNKAGVEIMSPHYTAYRDGNKSTVPNADETQNTPNDPVSKAIKKITKPRKPKS